jgi:hypothetical protein
MQLWREFNFMKSMFEDQQVTAFLGVDGFLPGQSWNLPANLAPNQMWSTQAQEKLRTPMIMTCVKNHFEKHLDLIQAQQQAMSGEQR